MLQATTELVSQGTGETTFAPSDPPGGSMAQIPSSPSAEDASRTWHFPSYLSYIRHVAEDLAGGLCFDLLMCFFNTLPGPSLPPNQRPPTTTLVADAMNDGWRYTKSIIRELLHRIDGVRARVIVIQCPSGKMAWIARIVLDLVAHFYDLSSTYVWGVLARHRVDLYCEGILERYLGVSTACLFGPAGVSALELIHTRRSLWDQVAVCTPSSSGLYLFRAGHPKHPPTCQSSPKYLSIGSQD